MLLTFSLKMLRNNYEALNQFQDFLWKVAGETRLVTMYFKIVAGSCCKFYENITCGQLWYFYLSIIILLVLYIFTIMVILYFLVIRKRAPTRQRPFWCQNKDYLGGAIYNSTTIKKLLQLNIPTTNSINFENMSSQMEMDGWM